MIETAPGSVIEWFTDGRVCAKSSRGGSAGKRRENLYCFSISTRDPSLVDPDAGAQQRVGTQKSKRTEEEAAAEYHGHIVETGVSVWGGNGDDEVAFRSFAPKGQAEAGRSKDQA